MAGRKDFHTVTPYMVLRDAAQAIEFYRKAFGATEISRFPDAKGKIMHAEIKIGDSPIMIVDESPDWPDMRSVQAFGGSPVQIFLYVEDVDGLVAQALEAGAKSVMPVQDKDYGRSGGVVDPFGLTWWITAHKEPASGTKSATG
jgi:PhnB protein